MIPSRQDGVVGTGRLWIRQKLGSAPLISYLWHLPRLWSWTSCWILTQSYLNLCHRISEMLWNFHTYRRQIRLLGAPMHFLPPHLLFWGPGWKVDCLGESCRDVLSLETEDWHIILPHKSSPVWPRAIQAVITFLGPGTLYAIWLSSCAPCQVIFLLLLANKVGHNTQGRVFASPTRYSPKYLHLPCPVLLDQHPPCR